MDHETGEERSGERAMIGTEFEGVDELERVANGLARASRHPIHVDLGSSYEEGGVSALSQMELGETHGDAVERLEHVEPQGDIHVVWNNRDDGRAYIGSQRYNLIQHREVIDAIREAVGRTTGSIERGVVRDYGAHVSGVLVFGDQDNAIIDVEELVGDGYVPPEGEWPTGVKDRLGLGMRFHNSFDGRSGFGGSTMGYRFICGNWLVWGEEEIDQKSSYHLKGEDDAPGVDPEYFEELIHTVFEQRDPLEGIVKDSIEEGEMPLSWAPGVLERAGFGKTYQKRIVSRLLSWEGGPDGDTDKWTLYNAATFHLDNERVDELGPERYDHHQGSAWAVLEDDLREPGEEVAELNEFAAGVSA
jgi:hypothetical protein